MMIPERDPQYIEEEELVLGFLLIDHTERDSNLRYLRKLTLYYWVIGVLGNV